MITNLFKCSKQIELHYVHNYATNISLMHEQHLIEVGRYFLIAQLLINFQKLQLSHSEYFLVFLHECLIIKDIKFLFSVSFQLLNELPFSHVILFLF